ncbi:glycosyltransferase family 2 protein [Pseudogracilibacillus sp. SO10305]|uniref:glycosyltransferase family 2 protein n=1 Tax=Pseudogracilibacillus sp. SO10305 TaxID=3098292 RepID=UPI00300E2750
MKKKNEELLNEYEKISRKVNEIEDELKREKLLHSKKELEFQKIQKSTLLELFRPSLFKRKIRTIGSYLLGRRNRKQLYSKVYKQKQAMNDLKPYIKLLYNDGFVEEVVRELTVMYQKTTNKYLKTSIAWELGLYYANKKSIYHTNTALTYIQQAKKNVTNTELFRQMTIVEAECYEQLNKLDEAKLLLTKLQNKDSHPDISLALANTISDINEKLIHVNKVYEQYSLQPIFFGQGDNVSYDDLQTKDMDHQVLNGPKISVILPAYNCENEIKTAIESLLDQTWKNIEVLIVDDCSTDGTFNVAKEYEQKDKRIKVLQTPENSGPYVARNLALEIANGEYITVNDADDWSHIQKLEIQVKHLIINPTIIANTSQLSRLTEDLLFYRRGTRGRYLFSNMSSLMFRRKEVLETIGYWDSVRFAADGEYKRRMTLAFGNEAVVDLETGPLSLPRQAAGSLTSSSSFGYNGYFIGARKEYVESFTYHHSTNQLYYPKTQKKRLFPIPYPMKPNQPSPNRIVTVDIIIVADFTRLKRKMKQQIIHDIEMNKQLGYKTGLIQMHIYDTEKSNSFDKDIRKIIDGELVRMIVYGEHIQSILTIVYDLRTLHVKQEYIPLVKTVNTLVIIDEKPTMKYNDKVIKSYQFRLCTKQIMGYFNKRGRWYPYDEKVREQLKHKEMKEIRLAKENWFEDNIPYMYEKIIKDWMIK